MMTTGNYYHRWGSVSTTEEFDAFIEKVNMYEIIERNLKQEKTIMFECGCGCDCCESLKPKEKLKLMPRMCSWGFQDEQGRLYWAVPKGCDDSGLHMHDGVIYKKIKHDDFDIVFWFGKEEKPKEKLKLMHRGYILPRSCGFQDSKGKLYWSVQNSQDDSGFHIYDGIVYKKIKHDDFVTVDSFEGEEKKKEKKKIRLYKKDDSGLVQSEIGTIFRRCIHLSYNLEPRAVYRSVKDWGIFYPYDEVEVIDKRDYMLKTRLLKLKIDNPISMDFRLKTSEGLKRDGIIAMLFKGIGKDYFIDNEGSLFYTKGDYYCKWGCTVTHHRDHVEIVDKL